MPTPADIIRRLLLPDTDNTRNLGSDSLRMALIRAFTLRANAFRDAANTALIKAGTGITSVVEGANGDYTINASGGGAGLWELIEEKTLVADAASVTFSGLLGDTTDKLMVLVMEIIKKSTTTTGTTLVFRPNGETANQTGKTIINAATGNRTDMPLMELAATDSGAGNGFIRSTTWIQAKALAGVAGRSIDTHGANFQRSGATNQMNQNDNSGISRNNTDQWTSFDIVALAGTTPMAIGSIFRLYRIKT